MSKLFGAWFFAGLALVIGVAIFFLIRNLDPFAYVSGDARVFIYWMDIWRDPAIFGSDPLARFFKDRSPAGYQLIFWLLYQAGLAPKEAAAALPLLIGPFLYAGTYLLAYEVCKRGSIAALSAAAYTLYCYPASSTPREFAAVTIVWCLVLLSRRSLLGVPLIIGLGALLYPIGALICCAMVGTLLFRWTEGKIGIDLRPRTLALIGLSALAALAAILLQASQYHPGTISYLEALKSPIFGLGGRNEFFYPDFTWFYLCSGRSGFLGYQVCRSVFLSAVAVAGLISFVVLTLRSSLPGSNVHIEPLVRVFLASCGLYVLAHLFLFDLYLPSRYTMWTMPLVAILSLGAVFSAVMDFLSKEGQGRTGLALAVGLALVMVTGAMLWFRWGDYIRQGFATPMTAHVEIIQAASELKPNESVASLEAFVSEIPLLSKRRILSAEEYFFGYDRDFQKLMVTRTADTADAILLDDADQLKDFIAKYDVGAFIVRDDAWRDGVWDRGWWTYSLPEKAAEVKAFRSNGGRSALERTYQRCVEARSHEMLFVSASCLRSVLELARKQ